VDTERSSSSSESCPSKAILESDFDVTLQYARTLITVKDAIESVSTWIAYYRASWCDEKLVCSFLAWYHSETFEPMS
jgi:hypothetical protein